MILKRDEIIEETIFTYECKCGWIGELEDIDLDFTTCDNCDEEIEIVD